MTLAEPKIPVLDSIRNIIFDFGGVLCDLDVRITEQRLLDLGIKNFDPAYSGTGSESIFSLLEAGKITPAEFRAALSRYLPDGTPDQAIDDAWNAMLKDIPESRIRLLEQLKKNYRIFLLSNSNEIHYACFLKTFREKFGYRDFDDLFEKAYFSYQIKMKKPDREIFEYVLRQSGLNPSETLFIDDSIQHIQTASSLGIKTFHLKPGTEVTSLFFPRTEH